MLDSLFHPFLKNGRINMTTKFIADAIEKFSDFKNIAISAKEISIEYNTSKKLDPCKEQKAIPNSVSNRYPGEISYTERFKEILKRVYRYNYSQEPRHAGKLNIKIDRTDKRNKIRHEKRKKSRKVPNKVDMNEDVDNLILIAVEYLRLPSDMADRAKLIMYNMWSHPNNFHGMKYENVVLGILMYVVYENYSEDVTVDFRGYCTLLFGEAQAERNIRQMYQAYEIMSYIYRNVEGELSNRYKRPNKRNRRFNKRSRKVYILHTPAALPLLY